MADYLERVEVYVPIRYQHLAVFPVRLLKGTTLRGSGLTMDQALSSGVLLVRQEGTGINGWEANWVAASIFGSTFPAAK